MQAGANLSHVLTIHTTTTAGVTAKTAVHALESMDWYFRGGGACGEKLIGTTGPRSRG